MVLMSNNRRTPFACHIAFLLCVLIIAISMPLLAATRAPATSKAMPTRNAPSIAAILHNVENCFSEIKDLTGVVDLEQYSTDGSVVQVQTTVQAVLPSLLRLDFVKPETFAGTFYVLDRNTNQIMQYSPITEQVIVSSIEQTLSERFVPTTVEQLFSLPSPEDYNLSVLSTEQHLVGVLAKAKNDPASPYFHFWIDQDTWIVSRMHVFEAQGQPLFTIRLRDVKINRSLVEAQLKRLPARAVTVYR